MKIRTLSTLAFIAVMGLSACGGKEERKGDNSLMVMEATGNAVVVRAGREISPKPGMLVGGEDMILTREGRLDLQNRAGAVVRLKSGSEMSVKRLVGGKDTELELKSGSLLARVEKTGARESFTVATPTAIAGVRGTSFGVTTGRQGIGVRVLDGRVAVQGVQKSSKEIIADDATRVTESAGSMNKSPSPVTSGEILEKASVVGVEEATFDKAARGQMSPEELSRMVSARRSEEVEKALASLETSRPRVLVLSSETELRQFYQDLDSVVLKNGQTITGAVISSDDGRIVMHTAKGIVRVQRSEIKAADIHSR